MVAGAAGGGAGGEAGAGLPACRRRRPPGREQRLGRARRRQRGSAPGDVVRGVRGAGGRRARPPDGAVGRDRGRGPVRRADDLGRRQRPDRALAVDAADLRLPARDRQRPRRFDRALRDRAERRPPGGADRRRAGVRALGATARGAGTQDGGHRHRGDRGAAGARAARDPAERDGGAAPQRGPRARRDGGRALDRAPARGAPCAGVAGVPESRRGACAAASRMDRRRARSVRRLGDPGVGRGPRAFQLRQPAPGCPRAGGARG